MDELTLRPATELAALLRGGQISARELTEAHIAAVERHNPTINAIVTFTPDRALARARELDAAMARGDVLGPLHGLPVAHKDLQETRGVRTTYGSPLHADFVPDFDSLLVERMRDAGAISLGKTNVPEFGAGSQTFNPVFGATRNPHDLTKTVGGSSGGAAAALACGMVALADGSDMGGSLRNPASFCGVVGLRPSAGRVPRHPASMGWFELSVDGPLGRTVGDVALLLSAIAGPDDSDPIALPQPGSSFAAPLDRDLRGLRVAWTDGLGLPYDPAVLAVYHAARARFEAMGCAVSDATPDMAEADFVFATLRAWSFHAGMAETLRLHRDKLKATIVGNIEAGGRLSGADIAEAERQRTTLYHKLRAFFADYDCLVLPTVQVPPFAVACEYPTEIAGTPMGSYIDWMRSCSWISACGLPAISVPCGATSDGLPIGLQIVGRYRDDWGLLQVAHAFEREGGGG